MLKVLIVDDESMVRKGIVLGFDWAADCVIGRATNGEERLAAVEAYNPNLIITDVRMPRMDGLEMLSELRRRGNRAHVILLTAYSDFSMPEMHCRMERMITFSSRFTIRISGGLVESGKSSERSA